MRAVGAKGWCDEQRMKERVLDDSGGAERAAPSRARSVRPNDFGPVLPRALASHETYAMAATEQRERHSIDPAGPPRAFAEPSEPHGGGGEPACSPAVAHPPCRLTVEPRCGKQRGRAVDATPS